MCFMYFLCFYCLSEGCILSFFFFSSRRRHTRLQGDWSSDVCSSDEIGVFEMSDRGLVEVPNPSALFLADRNEAGGEDGGARTAGAAVFAGIEGTRPVLVEVQALVAPSLLGTPRRAVVGW